MSDKFSIEVSKKEDLAVWTAGGSSRERSFKRLMNNAKWLR
jgi:hypothetical protein